MRNMTASQGLEKQKIARSAENPFGALSCFVPHVVQPELGACRNVKRAGEGNAICEGIFRDFGKLFGHICRKFRKIIAKNRFPQTC